MEDTAEVDGSGPLFNGLNFVIIPTSIPEKELEQLTTDITNAGGTILPFDPAHGRINKLEEVHYIIAATSDFPDYHRALDIFIHPVKPSWVHACLSISKIKNPRAYNPDPALFLNEVVVCCGDLPEGDKEAIEGGTIAVGGQYARALNKQTTHLFALDMEDDRCQLAIAKKLKLQILLPHWFDDCLKVGRRISERPYLLPEPEILRTVTDAPRAQLSPHIRDAVNPVPDPFPPTPLEGLEPARVIKAFNGKKIKLGEDLGLGDRLKEVITTMIQAGGGEVTEKIGEAHIYVCNYRDGSDYIEASKAKKDVGNLSWLYYLITYNTWTNPMRRLLHYPRPRDGIPSFKDFKISISGYTGEARVYLENLVRATGAVFTKTFKQENTHLISAHSASEKCQAAREWGAHLVNHLWLEESYAKGRAQTLTDDRYIFFPTRTNLGEILGQTGIDREAVESSLFPKKAPSRQRNMPAPSVPKRIARDMHDADEANTPIRRGKALPPALTPVAQRQDPGNENDTPGTTGSRGAKARALSKLHDSANDIAKFEKEMKRKGGVTHGGRRDKDAEVENNAKKTGGRDSTASKRSFDELDGDEEASGDASLSDDQAKKNKRSKKDKLTPIKYRMLVTKDERWQGNAEKESKDKGKLREIGLFITDDFKKVDLLCAPKAGRTPKFVSALACGPTLVASSFLDYALKHNNLPPPEKHLLKDREFEALYGFSLDESIRRARQNQKRLLKNWTIFCTPNVQGGKFEVFQDIVAANGGNFQKWTGRPTHIKASKRSIDMSDKEVSQNQEEDEGDVLYLVSEPKKSEMKLWPSFRELAKTHDMVPRIVTSEWLLFVAMKQYVHWDPKWELKEDSAKK